MGQLGSNKSGYLLEGECKFVRSYAGILPSGGPPDRSLNESAREVRDQDCRGDGDHGQNDSQPARDVFPAASPVAF
jgi:hypothetical protein